MEIGAVSNVTPGRIASSERVASAPQTPTAAADEKAATPAQFINPIGRYDQVARLFVLEFRDESNGEVKTQIPPERIVEEYRRLGFRRAAGVNADGGADGQPLLTGRPLTTRLPDPGEAAELGPIEPSSVPEVSAPTIVTDGASTRPDSAGAAVSDGGAVPSDVSAAPGQGTRFSVSV